MPAKTLGSNISRAKIIRDYAGIVASLNHSNFGKPERDIGKIIYDGEEDLVFIRKEDENGNFGGDVVIGPGNIIGLPYGNNLRREYNVTD